MLTTRLGPGARTLAFFDELAGNKEPYLLDILKEASTRITTVIEEADKIDEDYDWDGNLVADFSTFATFNKSDLTLYLTLSMVFWKELKNYTEDFHMVNMISECNLKCYVRVPKQQQNKWLNIFTNHKSFFFISDLDGYDLDDYVEIGLHRPMISFKKELEAFLDGRSSRTPVEIKQMFEDFLNAEPFGFPNNLKPELEAILNEFLNCIENHT